MKLTISALFLLTTSVYCQEYTFEDFERDFERNYDAKEREMRRVIFDENVKVIEAHSHPSYRLGVTEFTDKRDSELPLGLAKPSRSSATSKISRHLRSGTPEQSFPFSIDPIEKLPKDVSWQHIATPVKNQGQCGSCWAFASTAVLESHLYLQQNVRETLSTQELVSCVPNEYHCGGDGGCLGSTADLAYDYVELHGLATEWEFGYQSYDGSKIQCKESRPFVNIGGWIQLPRNNETVVMNALAKVGPIAVSVAASTWSLYKGGVFVMDFNVNNTRTTDINHLVVLEGYGTDSETQEDYWLVRNSWGPLWGENGYIRLKRTIDCGMDVTPTDGIACTKDTDGNDVVPPAEEICGTSGVLFDTHIPVAVTLA